MNLNKYMKKDREKLFPYIDDFSKTETYYRNLPTNKLNYSQWFWHKPEAYILMKYGIFLMFAINFIIIGIFLYKVRILSFLMFGIALGIIIYWITTLKNIKYDKHTTFYDIWIKDY